MYLPLSAPMYSDSLNKLLKFPFTVGNSTGKTILTTSSKLIAEMRDTFIVMINEKHCIKYAGGGGMVGLIWPQAGLVPG